MGRFRENVGDLARSDFRAAGELRKPKKPRFGKEQMTVDSGGTLSPARVLPVEEMPRLPRECADAGSHRDWSTLPVFCLLDSGGEGTHAAPYSTLECFDQSENPGTVFLYSAQDSCVHELSVSLRACLRTYTVPGSPSCVAGRGGCVFLGPQPSLQPAKRKVRKRQLTEESDNDQGDRTDCDRVSKSRCTVVLPAEGGLHEMSIRTSGVNNSLEAHSFLPVSGEVLYVTSLPRVPTTDPRSSASSLCIAFVEPGPWGPETDAKARESRRHLAGPAQIECMLISVSPFTILSRLWLALPTKAEVGAEVMRAETGTAIPEATKCTRSRAGVRHKGPSTEVISCSVIDGATGDGLQLMLLVTNRTGDRQECLYAVLKVVTEEGGKPVLRVRTLEVTGFSNKEEQLSGQENGLMLLESENSTACIDGDLKFKSSRWNVPPPNLSAFQYDILGACCQYRKSTRHPQAPGLFGRLGTTRPCAISVSADGRHLQVYLQKTTTGEIVLARRLRRLFGSSGGNADRKSVGGAFILNDDVCVEWHLRGDNVTCDAVVRELTWGTPCTCFFKVQLPDAVAAPPFLLPAQDSSSFSTSAHLVWQTFKAVFCVPLPSASFRTSRAVGSVPSASPVFVGEDREVNRAGNVSSFSIAHRQLLRALGLVDEKELRICLTLLGVCQGFYLPESTLLTPDDVTRNLFLDHERRKEIEKLICKLLQKGVLRPSSSLVSLIIGQRLQQAAECFCRCPAACEHDVVRLLCWRPALLLRYILLYAPRMSKSLLVQGLQGCFSRAEFPSQKDTMISMLQQLLDWLVRHTSCRAPAPNAEVPPLELILDFVAVLVDAKLPRLATGRDATVEERAKERVLFAKISEAVEALLQVDEASALRKIEGRLSAALSQTHTMESGEAGSDKSLIQQLTILL
ncbi:hypothetical protein CSUI_003838 [Cystoisospora suis]|uniref:Uncharacterized protein n=1 Tax=Cystoisospora suis TaxID=483139 RepID=A0A2C6L104_9APIC|nr:hypothetical protein CSUI_003838 [Cystoisospora suis]